MSEEIQEDHCTLKYEISVSHDDMLVAYCVYKCHTVVVLQKGQNNVY